MPGQDYIFAKQRMLMVAEVSDLMLRAPDKLRFDEQTYKAVAVAMAMNRDDVRAVFAEVDMLRATLGYPVVPEGVADDGGTGGVQAVEGVSQPEDHGGGGEERGDGPVLDSPVQVGGADGERTQRPKPRRNKPRNKKGPRAVDPGVSGEPVGGAEGRSE